MFNTNCKSWLRYNFSAYAKYISIEKKSLGSIIKIMIHHLNFLIGSKQTIICKIKFFVLYAKPDNKN